MRIALHGRAGIDAFTPTAERIVERLGTETSLNVRNGEDTLLPKAIWL